MRMIDKTRRADFCRSLLWEQTPRGHYGRRASPEAAPSEAPAPPQTVGDLKRIFSLAAAKEVPPAPAAEEPRAASKAPPAGGSTSDESDDDVVPVARFDPALTALAEACNAFDQTRVATQSCPYKFTTVLLKTSTHLVGKSWAEFHDWYSQKRKTAREKARAPKPKRRKVAVPVVGATEGASPAAAARPAVSGAVPVDDEPSDERAATAPVSMLSPTLPAPLPSTS